LTEPVRKSHRQQPFKDKRKAGTFCKDLKHKRLKISDGETGVPPVGAAKPRDLRIEKWNWKPSAVSRNPPLLHH